MLVASSPEIEATVCRILQSEPFHRMAGLQRFLQYIVLETLAGRGDQIKEYSIGVGVYARGTRFDPRCDTIVRVEAGKLRRRLQDYYCGEGRADRIIISMPKGGYMPRFQIRGDSGLDERGRKDPEELRALGWYLLQKLTPPAISESHQYFWKAIRANPRDPVCYADLAQAYAIAMSGDLWPDECEPRLRMAAAEALRLDCDRSEVQVAAAILAGGCEGDLQGAKRCIRKALNLRPENSRAHYWATYFLCLDGNSEEAIAHSRKAARLEPMSLMLRLFIGVMLHFGRKHLEARDHFLELMQIEPDYYLTHFWLSRTYAELGRHEEAIVAGVRAVDLSHTFMTLWSLACSYARMGEQEKAEVILEQLQNPRNAMYVSNGCLAAVYGALRRYQEAAEWLDRGRQAGEWSVALANLDPGWSRCLKP